MFASGPLSYPLLEWQPKNIKCEIDYFAKNTAPDLACRELLAGEAEGDGVEETNAALKLAGSVLEQMMKEAREGLAILAGNGVLNLRTIGCLQPR